MAAATTHQTARYVNAGMIVATEGCGLMFQAIGEF